MSENDSTLWDWITWETLGNPSEKYQRGDKSRKLGLWRIDYELACKAGKFSLAPEHEHGLGRGLVKVVTLRSFDYSSHKGLVATFLPCMDVVQGKVIDPLSSKKARSKVGPLYLVLPYNYDDNSRGSGALGTRLNSLSAIDARRIVAELTRWSTASRSSITAIPDDGVDCTQTFTYAKKSDDFWPFRDKNNTDAKIDKKGQGNGQLFLDFQAKNKKFKYYSVKTGVEFVAGENQAVNGKDVLEANSVHAMDRSDLIASTMARYGAEKFEARYQLEILSVLIFNGTWDGFQVREISQAGAGEVWFPALSIPSHGKNFAKSWGGTDDWIAFWQLNFAQPLGRAKAEMLLYFGLQHMTANSQNMLIVFDRTRPKGNKPGKAVTLRDLGDTLYNNHVFKVLNQIDQSYSDAWSREDGDKAFGVTLDSEIGGGYSRPLMTRVGASIVFFFPPFVQGDLKTENTAKVLACWGVAHNRAFAQYMIEKIGYTRNWELGQAQDTPQDLGPRLRKFAGFSNSITIEYGKLFADICKLRSADRWAFIDEIESEIAQLTKDQLEQAKGLVDGHEMLICSDVEAYLRSKEGIVGLTALHKGTSVHEGLACSSCGAKHSSTRSGTWGRWHRCSGCHRIWCNTCGKWWLWRPSWLVEERKCSSCGKTTELIE
jgi:hypothetical protein